MSSILKLTHKVPTWPRLMNQAIIITLALVFIVAGLSKLTDPQAAMPAIEATLPVNQPTAKMAVILVALVDASIGTMLLIMIRAPRWPLFVGVVALIIYTLFLVSTELSSKDIPCGCFGALSGGKMFDSVAASIGRNMILLFLAGISAKIITLRA